MRINYFILLFIVLICFSCSPEKEPDIGVQTIDLEESTDVLPISSFIKKFFGSRNGRILKEYAPLVKKINELEDKYQKFTQSDFQVETKLLKEYPDMYKNDFDFVWAYCKYFWECHVDFPEMDINKLESLVVV